MEQVQSKGKQMKKLKREIRRVKQESEMAANEMQPQLRKLVDMVKASKVRIGWRGGRGQTVERRTRSISRADKFFVG